MNNAARCRRCGRPIIFLTEEPADVRVGNTWPPVIVRSQPKPHPIDAEPPPNSTARANIAIYAYPGKRPGRQTLDDLDRPTKFYYRRLEPLVLEMLLKCHEPPELYTSHFDTCPKPDRPRFNGR